MRTLTILVVGLLSVGCGKSDTERLEEEKLTQEYETEFQMSEDENKRLEAEIESNKLKAKSKKTQDELLRLSVVGEYDYKEGSPAYTHFFLENGITEMYRNGEKRNDAKWSISNGELHVVRDYGEIHVFRINKDKSITEIALIKDKKRSDWPYEVNTLKKIK